MNDSEAEELAAWNGTRNGSGDDGPESSRLRVPRIQTLWFNTTLAGFRDATCRKGGPVQKAFMQPTWGILGNGQQESFH